MTDQQQPIPGLMDEPPISVYPSLAVHFNNVNKAIVLQQLHFLLGITQKAKSKYNEIDGEWWVYNTYKEWQQEHFPWLSVSTMKRLLVELEADGIIKSRQSVKHKSDRRKWYTINYVNLRNALTPPTDQNRPLVEQTKIGHWNGPKESDGYTETTTETTTDKKDSVAQKQSDAVAADKYLYELPISEAAIIATLKALHDNPDGVAVNADAFNVAVERELIVNGEITPGGYELIGVDIDDTTDNAWLEQHALDSGKWFKATWIYKDGRAVCMECGGMFDHGGDYYHNGKRHLCPGCYLDLHNLSGADLIDHDSKLSGDDIQHMSALAAELGVDDTPPALTAEQAECLGQYRDDNKGLCLDKQPETGQLSGMGYISSNFDKRNGSYLRITPAGRTALEAWQLLQKEQQVQIDYPAAKAAPQLPIGDDENSDDIDEPIPPPEQVEAKKARKATLHKCYTPTTDHPHN